MTRGRRESSADSADFAGITGHLHIGMLLDVIAAGAEPSTVALTGGTARGVRVDVVSVRDGSVTERGAAGLVAQPDQWASRPG